MTHKIEYLSLLQMYRQYEKEDAHLTRIEEGERAFMPHLEESKISGSMML